MRGRTSLTLAAVVGGVLTAMAPVAAQAAEPAGTATVRTGGTPLNVRSTPTSAGSLMRTLANGSRVAISCLVTGDNVSGTVRTTRAWDRLPGGGYVADAYLLRTGIAIGPCPPAGQVEPPPVTAGDWTLPVLAPLVSGFRTVQRPNHDGVDLGAARNTPIRAAAAGRVRTVVCNVSAGTCDVDGSPALTGCGWYVEIEHAGGIVTRYCHMVRRPSVTVGQSVVQGQIIGYVGTSGSSSGPHLHFEVHTGAPATRANAINPIPFLAARGLIIR